MSFQPQPTQPGSYKIKLTTGGFVELADDDSVFVRTPDPSNRKQIVRYVCASGCTRIIIFIACYHSGRLLVNRDSGRLRAHQTAQPLRGRTPSLLQFKEILRHGRSMCRPINHSACPSLGRDVCSEVTYLCSIQDCPVKRDHAGDFLSEWFRCMYHHDLVITSSELTL